MDELKSQIEIALQEVFESKKDLDINEVEFSLIDFWKPRELIPEAEATEAETKDEETAAKDEETEAETEAKDEETEAKEATDAETKSQTSKIKKLRPPKSNSAFGVILFDSLSRVLKGTYQLEGPKYQMVINKAESGMGGGPRVILEGQSTIQTYCENPETGLSGEYLKRDSPIHYETKRRVQTNRESKIEKEYGLRLRMSQEKTSYRSSDFNWFTDNETDKIYRYRKRYSYLVPIKSLVAEVTSDSKSEKAEKAEKSEKVKQPEGVIHFDLSVYKLGFGKTFNTATSRKQLRPSNNSEKSEHFMAGSQVYDIEIEFRLPNKKSLQVTDLENLKNWLADPVYLSLQMLQMSSIVIPNSHSLKVYQSYLKLVKKEFTDRTRFVGANVYPMGLQNVLDPKSNPAFEPKHISIDEYAFTIKADGTRNLLYIDDRSQAYLIDMNHIVRSLGVTIKDKALKNCLLDTELIDNRSLDQPPAIGNYSVLVFDALFFNGADIRNLTLFPKTEKSSTYRFKAMVGATQVLIETPVENQFYNFEIKDYYRLPYHLLDGKIQPSPNIKDPKVAASTKSVNDLVLLETKLRKNPSAGKFPKDGLILTNMYMSYPVKEMTITTQPPQPTQKSATTISIESKTKDNKAVASDRDFSFKVKNLDQLSVDFFYRPTPEKKFAEFGESLQYSLWIQRNGPKPFRPTYSVLPGANTAYVKIEKQIEIFQGNPDDPSKSIISNDVMRAQDGFLIIPNFVYESIYKKDLGAWIPTKHRPVKTIQERANYYDTANSTWEMILNILMNPKMVGEITENNLIDLINTYINSAKKTRTPITFEAWLKKNLKRPPRYFNSEMDSSWAQNAEKNPYVMPMNFMHNQVKSLLYQATAQASDRTNLRLLELAVGKGPDYIRWQTNNITKVVGIEIDYQQIGAGIQRHEDRWQKFKAQRGPKPIDVAFLQGDITQDLNTGEAGKSPEDKMKLRRYLGSKNQFDIVSCQFAIHFAMRDRNSFSHFMTNVSQNLRPGGFFIGTSFIASRSKEEQVIKITDTKKTVGPGVYDTLAPIKSKTKQPELSYTEDDNLIWSIEKGPNFGTELGAFGQNIIVYLLSLHREPTQEYLVNLTSEEVIEIAKKHKLKMIKLPNSVIGADDRPQAFGEVYSEILANANDPKTGIKPIPMLDRERKPVDIPATLKTLLENDKMAQFSLMNSLFVFQKMV